jgi:hypothetical protein
MRDGVKFGRTIKLIRMLLLSIEEPNKMRQKGHTNFYTPIKPSEE